MANAWFGRQGARLIAAGRVAAGIGMIARPETLPKLLGVDSGTAERSAFLGRMLGAREIALGAGLLLSRSTAGEREWVLGAALSDAVDGVAFAAAARRGVVRPVLAGAFVATAAVATGMEVAAWLDGRE